MHGLVGLGVEDHYVDEMCRQFFRGACEKRFCLSLVNLRLADKNPGLFRADDSLNSRIRNHCFLDELALFRVPRSSTASRDRSGSKPFLLFSLSPCLSASGVKNPLRSW